MLGRPVRRVKSTRRDSRPLKIQCTRAGLSSAGGAELEVREAVSAHSAGLELRAERDRVLTSEARGLCRSFAVKNDELGIWIESRPAINQPWKMEFRAGVLVRCAREEECAFEVECKAIGELEEDRVVQVFARVLENSERFASLHGNNLIRQVFRSKHGGGCSGRAQLAPGLKGQARCFGRR